MSSSPRTSPYNLRSRTNSPDGKPTNEKKASETFPSSQSESSDTEDITTDDKKTQETKSSDISADETDVSQSESSDSEDITTDDKETQETKSSDIAADETDAAISRTSARNVTVKDKDVDSRTDKSDAKIKCDSKEIYDRRKNTGKQSIPTPTLLQIIFIVLAISISLVVQLRYGTDMLSFPHSNNEHVQFNERPVAYRLRNLTTELERIKTKYAALDDTFWDVIAGSSWSHIQGNGTIKQPVVLLLVGQPKSSILDVVANDVARLYSKVFTMKDDSTIHIDGGWQAMKEADQAKLDMDNDLKNGFNNGSKVVLLRQFDKLPPCSIMLFHSYCDNENAPHKDAVIIFTVELETTVSNTAQGIEELVQDHLGSIWAQCPEELLQDKIMAMHSRVSNNIAFVK